MSNINRRSLVKGSLAAIVTGAALSRAAFAQSSEPITVGRQRSPDGTERAIWRAMEAGF